MPFLRPTTDCETLKPDGVNFLRVMMMMVNGEG